MAKKLDKQGEELLARFDDCMYECNGDKAMVKIKWNGEYIRVPKDEDGNMLAIYFGNIFACKDDVSSTFNQFRGKIFNLIDSSTQDETQREAAKGLIKGFIRDAQRDILDSFEKKIEDGILLTDTDQS